MIYLFNSGFADVYRRNVLRTLLLPDRARNEFRYRYQGDRINLERVEQFETAVGEEVVILFIDRYSSGGYRYFPIRRGQLASTRRDGDQFFFEVELGDVIWPFDPTSTSQLVLSKLKSQNLPQLRTNPDNRNDGLYGLVADSMFGNWEHFRIGDSAWTEGTKFLGSLPAFSTLKPDEQPLFAHLVLPPTAAMVDGKLSLRRGTECQLRLRYWFPANSPTQKETARIEVRPGQGVGVLGSPEILVDGSANSVPIRISATKQGEDTSSGLYLVFSGQSGKLIAPDQTSLPIEINESRLYWLWVSLGIFFFAAGGALIKMDLPPDLAFSAVVRQLTPANLVGPLIQSAALFFLLRVVGKKFL
jgi:hypothetical protein